MSKPIEPTGGPSAATERKADSPRENPFASRYVRPGALPFISDAFDPRELVDRLAACDWNGAILGPHGSGKSTLLSQLGEELGSRGCRAETVVAGGAVPEALAWLTAERCRGKPVLLLDGYDLLPAWKRWWIRRRCRRTGIGLLVTSHRPVGLPVLIMTSTSLQLALRLSVVLAGDEFAAECDALIRDSFRRHGGNLREVWFDLYDRYERTHPRDRDAVKA